MEKKRRQVLQNQARLRQTVLLAYIPGFVFKISSVVLRYALRYFLLAVTFLTEFRKVYIMSTKRFNGGLSYDQLQLDLGNLSKLPRHMSFVINEDVSTDYCDIANLIVWTIAMGIPYITLYEQHGILKAGETRLGKVVRQKLSQLFSCKGPSDIDIIMRNGKTALFKNGMVYPQQVSVHLLSEEDGKPDIMDTTIKLATDYSQKNISLKDIDINLIDTSLHASHNTPDPEVSIQFGPVNSLLGFLPWQTRLTEIFHCPTHKNISYLSFYELLKRYSKCNQRFGK